MRLFLGLALCLAVASAQKRPITLEALQKATPPFAFGGSPVWAPDGLSFVFTQAEKLMHYDVAAKQAREVLTTKSLTPAKREESGPQPFTWENRGVREEALQWARDGKSLLLTSGGDLFWVELATGKATPLTNTPDPERDPKLSPDNTKISFRRDHDLYVLDIASKKVTRLTTNGSATLLNGELDWVYPEELSLGTAHWWSPDSKSIAYLQFDVSPVPLYPHADLTKTAPLAEPERYPQAGDPNANVRLGIVSATGGATKWMDLGDTRDQWLIARVHWMPHSKSLFVQRLNRIQNRLDLLRVDVANGASVDILRETDPYWVNLGTDGFGSAGASDQSGFLAGGKQFLWSSERDGFRHLYLYSADGRESRQITKGAWEVSQLACVDERAQRLYYVSTEVSPLERHLFSIGFDGSNKQRLTKAEGTHSIAMGPGCAYFLDSHSNLTNPTRRVLYKNDGTEHAVYREADRKQMEEFDILPTELLNFKTSDGVTLYARLIKPKGFDPSKKYPVIVSVYGGPHAQNVRNAWSGVSWEQVMAHKGFVIWQVDNRGTSGRGHAFETPVFRKLGVLELEDQKEGVKHLISLGFADPARIGIYGWSYGGFMTLNAMLNAPDIFKAGSSGAPVTHFKNYDTIYTERYMGLPHENPDGYAATNLPLKAGNLKGKLLLIHNFEDDNVLFQNMLQATDALQRAGKPFQLMVYPQKSHGVGGRYREHLNALQTQFFEEALK
jgi:dipeptidyl-peptidase-4